MNQKAITVLEYKKIVQILTNYASSALGKELCQNLAPIPDLKLIRSMQRETADALGRVYKFGSLSFSGLHDIRPHLRRLEVGSTLGMGELLSISSLLGVATRVKAYSRNKKNGESEEEQEGEGGDSLSERFDAIQPLTSLNTEIKRCILSEDQMSDDASPTLKHIRRTIVNTQNRIHEQLNSIVNSSQTKTMLQESLVTMRNNRYCLPVKQEYKSSFPGMVHDHSSSGSTTFIEPMAVVKLNNELTELAVKEQEEVEKILAELSNLAAEESDFLALNLDVLTELDFLFAKAALAKAMDATEPIFNENGFIHIKKGRHPLIDKCAVVPTDITLGRDFRLLVITGPNTGGKTVSLKTVGLLTLMGQAGLHIPAFDHSELAVFEDVFADIGDEQSIEQSLSTFSSHMTNIVTIMSQATSRSLVLFDELGAGTDPTEGAALAMSILTDLRTRGVTTMATTHYSELKLYALETEGVENACLEFDVETLRPTYHLLIGIPGKSNAFAIASKLGLPDNIIEGAKSHVGNDEQRFEDVIKDLDDSRSLIKKEQEEIHRKRKEVDALYKEWMKKKNKVDQAKERVLRKANEEAREILQAAKEHADESIRRYNKWMADGANGRAMEQEREGLRDRLLQTEERLSVGSHPSERKTSKQHKPGDFKIGDAVNVLSLGLRGTVSTLPNDKGDMTVQMGILSSQININDVELLDEPTHTHPKAEKAGGGKIKSSKALAIQTDVNLIGKTVDEALSELDKYLDDAYLSHLHQVTVIHGRGTGALRNAVHSHLKKTKYVKGYRLGEFGEGGQGVTIVEFKS